MACCAILLATLAPTITQALVVVYGNGASWADICSAAGFKRVQITEDGKPGEPAAPVPPVAAMADHCPYCTLHSHAMAPPPALSTLGYLPLSTYEVPALFLTAPRTAFAWAAAQARAPPQHA